MKRGENNLDEEKLVFLSQLIRAMEEGTSKLEVAYRNKNSEQFHKLKKFILEVQSKISQNLT